MKVYGGNMFLHGQQVRAIVAGTQKKVSELTGLSLHYIRGYWSETGNALELETALACPGILFWTPMGGKRDYKPAPAPATAETGEEG